MKIIHTDNFGGDDPDEKFVTELPRFHNGDAGRAKAEAVCKAVNAATPDDYCRFYMVVEDDYVLKPGFEP